METHGLICPHESHSASHSSALHDTWSRIKWDKLMEEASSDFYVHGSLSPSLAGRQSLSPYPLQALVCWSLLTRGLPSSPQALSGSICWFWCNTTPTGTYSKLLLWCPWVGRWRVNVLLSFSTSILLPPPSALFFELSWRAGWWFRGSKA